MTVDDLMKLRSIVDVRISPDGERVAYVVSTPSLPKNEHEAALFVVPAAGGTPIAARRSGPHLQHADATAAAALVAGRHDRSRCSASMGPRPQVFAFRRRRRTAELDRGARRRLRVRMVARRQEPRLPHARSDARRRGAPAAGRVVRHPRRRADRPTRLAVQQLDRPTPPRLLTPPTHYVDGFSWSPDGREIAYSAAPRSGFSAAVRNARVRRRRSRAATPRTIVDRAGMNTGRVFSPDGRQIAFISTNGRTDIMASRSLTVVAAGRRRAAGVRAGRRVGERVRVGARQPLDLPAGERRHVRARRAHVRAADRRACRSPTAAPSALGTGADRRLLHQPQPATASGSPTSRSKRGRWAMSP